MANPLKLPFDFPPNTKPETHKVQANFNALLQFVSDLNTAVISLSNLIVGTLQTTSTATIGGALTAQAAATVAGVVTANNGVTVNNAALVTNAALTANSTAALNGAVTAASTVVATGLITGNNGVTVNNAALTANSTTALNGAATAASTLGVTGDISALSKVKLSDSALALTFTSSSAMGLQKVSTNRMALYTSSTKGWDMDATGNITLPVQPAFLVTIDSTAGANVFGDGPAYTVPWGVEVLDRSSAFNMTTKTFTAAVDGVYAFVCFLDTGSVNVSPVTPTVNIVTSNQNYFNNLPAYTTASCRGLSVVYTFMDAADTCSVTIAGNSLLGTKTADIDSGYFAGFLFG